MPLTIGRAAQRAMRRVMRARSYRWLRRRAASPLAGLAPDPVDFGSLRRVTPIGRKWGKDRGGLPIDRYYIERFLAAHAADVRGRVLEVGDDSYTRRFGGSAVTRCDVLHATPGNPRATLVGDLTRPGSIPADAYDCIVLTQVLHVLAEPDAAVRTAYAALRPGGVLLATMPGISQISRWDMTRWGDYWRFTDLSVREMTAAVFPPSRLSVGVHGNVLAAIAFLHGLSAEELRPGELDHLDPDYQLILTVRAVRPEADA